LLYTIFRGYSFKMSGFVGIQSVNTWYYLFNLKSLGYATFFSSIFSFVTLKKKY
jgi:hypothetical protein